MHAETTRLSLRELALSDTPNIYALDSIPDNARYQTWPPRTPESADEFVQVAVSCSEESPRTFVELAVSVATNPNSAEKTEFIGRVGAHIDSKEQTAELWFSFMPHAQGKGYATEAVGALIELLRAARKGQEVPHFNRLLIECDPRNTASRRLAERASFVMQSCTERAFECKGEWVGSMVFVRDAD
ncbi:acetyltransferase [Roridomyces roridus]|uniref:Acetyltransferase n=1 Tax=Roridomyces roridus TaxID=1738132 RepID=A0AAD7FW94_9AGAR|nr:acetyltransferase [Roridomyces roridus]